MIEASNPFGLLVLQAGDRWMDAAVAVGVLLLVDMPLTVFVTQRVIDRRAARREIHRWLGESTATRARVRDRLLLASKVQTALWLALEALLASQATVRASQRAWEEIDTLLIQVERDARRLRRMMVEVSELIDDSAPVMAIQAASRLRATGEHLEALLTPARDRRTLRQTGWWLLEAGQDAQAVGIEIRALLKRLGEWNTVVPECLSATR